MAFLCPSSNKKKKEKGKRTQHDAYAVNNDDIGQREIDEIQRNNTLFEIVEDYFPCSALELPVKAGEIVRYISSEGSWIFISTENGSNGYIPRRHCRLIENNDRERNPSDVSDVGYYSDHLDDIILRRVDASRRHPHSDVHSRAGSDNSSLNEPVSSRSPASTNLSSYLRHSQGLYARHNSQNSDKYKPEHSALTYRNTSSHRVKRIPSQPVCGRKCQNGCTHGKPLRSVSMVMDDATKRWSTTSDNENGYKSQRWNATSFKDTGSVTKRWSSTPDHEQKSKRSSTASLGQEHEQNAYGTQRSSVISVSSGHESNPINDRNHHNPSEDEKIYVANGTQKSSNLHTMSEIKHGDGRRRQEKVHRIKQLRKENNRCHSAPVKLTINKKCGHPELIVIKDYEQQGETDLTIDRGDFAAIINDTKYDEWIYIMNEKGEKGFIPTECVIKHQCEDCEQSSDPVSAKRSSGDPTKYRIPDLTSMTSLAVIENYSGKDLDDLYVCVGEFVYADETEPQSIDGWLWVYSPRQKCFGYVPTSAVKDTGEVAQAEI